ncbi:MAG TPA: STAS domain-containing protein [Pilimelia sp.]|nr:STAS domain-containing protein [Pilimelia sp.]
MDTVTNRLVVTVASAGADAARVTVSGNLDVLTTAAFQSRLESALPLDRLGLLELDLAEVTFFDVAGARHVTELHRAAAARRCRVVVVDASDVVELVLVALGHRDLLGYLRPEADASPEPGGEQLPGAAAP